MIEFTVRHESIDEVLTWKGCKKSTYVRPVI